MYKTLRGQTSGTFKTQTLLDQEYLVIPVVAMVEGVRFGANQESAELGLASEFGLFPDSWNNRPIVLGHPKVDGNFVSAGSPSVMDTYCIGTTMGSRIAGKKLKVEAWLSTALEDKSDESKRMFERIRAGDQIEVSVGFFCLVEETEGEYNGEAYKGIWRQIATDHLAFLDEDSIGACSIADGCGAPRTNQSKDVTFNINTHDVPKPISKETLMAIQETVKKAIKNMTGTKTVAPHISPSAGAAFSVENLTTPKDPKVQCGCAKNVVSIQTLKPMDSKKGLELSPETVTALQSLHAMMFPALTTLAVPDGLLSSDIESALNEELSEVYDYAYVIGFTSSVVVYQGYMMNMGWCLYQQAFDIDADGAVAFSGEPEEVRLISRIVPIGSEDDDVTVNSTDVNATPTKETDMPTKPNTQEGAAGAATTTADNATNTATVTPAAVATVNTVTEPKKPVTMQEYLAQAPAELQEVLSEGVKLQASRKTNLIKGLQDSGRCDFDEAFLKSQSLAVLENMAKLATIPVDYTGAAGSVNTQTSDESNSVPAAPKALTRNVAAANTTAA